MIDYSIAAKTYDDSRRSDRSVVEMIAARGVFAKGRRVLDFGCGTGNYLAELSRLYECELFGLEPSDEMRTIAREKKPGIEIAKGDNSDMYFDNGFFDLIYMTDVIHHVPDLDLLFESMYSKLRSGGRVCIVTESWEQIEGRWYNPYFPSLAANEKARYPELATIIQRAKMADFRLEEIVTNERPGPHSIDEGFLNMVRKKNFSMFRILADAEYQAGLAAMTADLGTERLSPDAGESFVWLIKEESNG